MTFWRHFCSGTPRRKAPYWNASNELRPVQSKATTPFTQRRWCQLPQRPPIIETQPVFDERGMCRFKSGCQHLLIDCPQIFARTITQGAGEADQIVSRSRRAARLLCSGCLSILWGGCRPGDLEFRLWRSGAGKPASDRTHLPVF
jgi:hypothetical protein